MPKNAPNAAISTVSSKATGMLAGRLKNGFPLVMNG